MKPHPAPSANNMSRMRPGMLIVIGRIAKARGIRGDVHVAPLTDFPERFNDLDRVWLEMPDGSVVQRTVSHSSHNGSTTVLKLDGIDDRTEAETLRGAYISVDSTDLVELETDTYFVFDLEGLDVVGADGVNIGRVERVEQYPANDVLVVGTKDGQVMVPAVKNFVIDIDTVKRRITVDLPDGLPLIPVRGRER